jgi:hypothetical protein
MHESVLALRWAVAALALWAIGLTAVAGGLVFAAMLTPGGRLMLVYALGAGLALTLACIAGWVARELLRRVPRRLMDATLLSTGLLTAWLFLMTFVLLNAGDRQPILGLLGVGSFMACCLMIKTFMLLHEARPLIDTHVPSTRRGFEV